MTGQPVWNSGVFSFASDLWAQAGAYLTDAGQRAVLYADVMRERGNQYQQHMANGVLHVLDFPAEIILEGKTLPRPVNYALARVLPPEDVPTDPCKRPFVVVDPRAGHGPGIGGFKADSEVGVAIRAGHPCYFIGFLPDPVPGQTVEDVMHAEAAFLEKVIALHPCSDGKPTVIANCQAGWQILMTAAVWPELFGPIIVAGAPVSYWAGWPGVNPMRYSGGLLGGSWLTALTSDLGRGRFDGAWLVKNFENLNPANTLWGKQHNLYARVDTEVGRYLGFEKYWGGYVFLNDVEMQYIVDNLFIGNRLSTAQLITSEGVRIDLRNIRSPIVVFCSRGDNITPPPQALGWITDLYLDDEDVVSHDQTIVYAMHESIGHLGIFVSASVGRKEHQKFASNIDTIDLLPSGIYQAVIVDKTDDMINAELVDGDFVMSIQRRSLDDVRAVVAPDAESDRRFMAASRISDINLGLYRSFVQPWVRAAVTPAMSDAMRELHPLRISYERWSDRNVLAPAVSREAEAIRANRKPVSPDNPFWQLQENISQGVESALEGFREWRDSLYEKSFELSYGSPLVQALAGFSPQQPARPHPGVSPEHRAEVARKRARLRAALSEGGLAEAMIRGLIFVAKTGTITDERRVNLVLRMHRDAFAERSLDTVRTFIRLQSSLMRYDAAGAMAAIPQMLASVPSDEIRRAAQALEDFLRLAGLSQDEEEALSEVRQLFEVAARKSGDQTQTPVRQRTGKRKVKTPVKT